MNVQFYSDFYEPSLMLHGFMPGIMGTRFDAVIVGESKAVSESLWYFIVSELVRLEKMLNRFDAGSEIAHINASAGGKPVLISEEVWQILNDCKKYFRLTSGLFDITLNDFSKIIFNDEEKTIQLPAGFHLDLGGYAKGYALERIKKHLHAKNTKHALLNFGNSSIAAIGSHPFGDHWSIGIENPFNPGQKLGEVKLKNSDLSTSGNIPAHMGHIVHPSSGNYNEEKKVVCVETYNSIEGEVLTTSLMIAGEKEKKDIVAYIKTKKVFIYDDLLRREER